MMPRNSGPNIKYDVQIKNNINESNNNLIVNHGYNFMKLKNKNNIALNTQDINIQKPDKNILKIDDHYRIVGILALGHSDDIPKAHTFKDIDKNKVHFLV